MEIKTFKFKNDTVEIDVAFDGESYINATEIYHSFGKSRENFSYWKKTYLVPYVEKLIQLGKFPCQVNSDTTKCTVDEFIITRNGGIPHEQGTWLHPKLAIVFARWIDLEFEIWCDEKIAQLLSKGVTFMTTDDRKYLDLLNKVTDHTEVSDKQFIRLIKSIITLQETYGYNIKKFDDLLDTISQYSDRESRYKLYEKVSKSIEDLYQEGTIDITTRERMKKSCDGRVVMILKGRATRAENKLKYQSFSLPTTAEEKPVSASEDVPVNADDDGSLVEMTLDTNDVHTGIKAITDLCLKRDYRIFFQSCLMPKLQVDGKRLPNFTGEYVIPQKGRIGAAIWNNNNNYKFLRLSKYVLDGNINTILELQLSEFVDFPGSYSAINKAGTAYAVFNEPTGMLIVYGFKANK